MKIIHTADWHLGKLLCGIYLHEDQAFVLHQFYELLEREKPDLILFAGDIYDRSYPPVEAVRLLNECFKKILLELGIPMIVITGNHDHAERLNFGSELMEKSGLYLRAKPEKEIQPIIMKDSYGEWEFYPIPYADPATVRSLYEDSNIKTAYDAMKKILEPVNQRIREQEAKRKKTGLPAKRYVALAHSFFIGEQVKSSEVKEQLESREELFEERTFPEESDSERPLSVGGVDHIPAQLLSEFDYVALGHLHKPQKIEKESIRYSGSLLKYSFSEASHQKSVVILEWEEELHIRLEQLPVLRDVRVVKGTWKEIMEKGRKDQNREDYILAKLVEEEILIDPISELKAIYPNILGLEYERKTVVASSRSLQAGKDLTEKNIWDLFSEFYEHTTGNHSDISALKERYREEGANIYEAD